MTTGTPITSTLNITQDDVMGIVRRIIKVDGLEAARAAFKQMNEYFSCLKGWAETRHIGVRNLCVPLISLMSAFSISKDHGDRFRE